MESLPIDLEKKLENLPVVSFDDAEKLQSVLMSQDYTDLYTYYEQHYLPAEIKSKSELYKRLALYLSITNQDTELVNQIDTLLYRRPVPSIEEFLDNNRYMGLLNTSMYPYWREQLCKIFAENSQINRVLWSGATGTGKSLQNQTIIPTPEGLKKVEEIKVGDYLWGKNGKPTRVLGVYPQGKLETYKITFNDKTEVICSKDHLWTIDRILRCPIKNKKTLTTEQILNSGLLIKHKCERVPRYKYGIDPCEPVTYQEKKYDIHPYIIGVLLGDGNLSRKSNTSITINNSELDIKNKIEKLLPKDYVLKVYDRNNFKNAKDYHIINKYHNQSNDNYNYISFDKYLSKRNIENMYSYNKHIPQEYMYGSIEQRYELLRGLMDTDGSIRNRKNTKKSEIIFTTVSKQLADDICLLVRSLGGKAILTKTDLEVLKKLNKNSKIKPNYSRYDIRIQTLKNPFFTKRKATLYKMSALTTKTIIDIIPTGKIEECTCFEVDAEDHLFLCNDYIPTHNTVTARKAIIYALYRLLCLRNAREALNVEPVSTLACFILSVTQKTAYQTNFEPFIRILSNMPCFQRVRNMTAFENFDLTDPMIPFPFFVDKSNLTVVFKDNIILTLGSQISNTVGYDVVISGADEINEAGLINGMELLNSIDGRMDGRFANSPFTMANVMSSARSTESVTREYAKKWQNDKRFLYLHPMRFEVKSTADFTSETNFNVLIGNGIIPSTVITDPTTIKEITNNLYEPPAGCELVSVPDMYKPQFLADLDQSIQDILGIDTRDTKTIFRDTSNLEDPMLFPEMTLSVNIRENINILDILEPYNLWDQTLDDKYLFKRAPKALRYVHCDLAGSGDGGQCDAAVCILHKEWQKNQITKLNDTIYVVDLLLFINAKNKVDIHAIQQFLLDLVAEKNMPIHTITADQWQSLMFLQSLDKSGYFSNVKQLSVDIKLEPYSNAATLMELGHVKIGTCPKLKKELEALVLNKGKVERTTELKDGCDAIVGAIYNAQLNYGDFPQYEYSAEVKPKVKAVYKDYLTDNEQFEDLF